MHAQWKRNVREATRLQEAGLDDTVIDAAISGFITEVGMMICIIVFFMKFSNWLGKAMKHQ